MNINLQKSILVVAFALPIIAGCAAPQSNVNATNTGVNGGVNQSTASNTSGGAAHTDHSGMNHAAGDHAHMTSSPNAASAPYDLQFIDTMIAHHQGAVDMAQMAEKQAGREELKAFARKVMVDQQKENNQMREWRERWYPNQPPAINMEMTGMRESMQGMNMDALAKATGNAFDIEFVRQMIPHHEGAIPMSQEALARAEHAELKSLAERIIAEQQLEIKQMQVWTREWGAPQ